MTFTQLALDISLAAYLSDNPKAQIGTLIRNNIHHIKPKDKVLMRKVLKDKHRVRTIKTKLASEILKLDFGESA